MRVSIRTESTELLALLREIGESEQHDLDGLPNLPQSIAEFSQLVSVQSDYLSAEGTGELVVRLKPTERLIELVAATRARKGKLLVGQEVG